MRESPPVGVRTSAQTGGWSGLTVTGGLARHWRFAERQSLPKVSVSFRDAQSESSMGRADRTPGRMGFGNCQPVALGSLA